MNMKRHCLSNLLSCFCAVNICALDRIKQQKHNLKRLFAFFVKRHTDGKMKVIDIKIFFWLFVGSLKSNSNVEVDHKKLLFDCTDFIH